MIPLKDFIISSGIDKLLKDNLHKECPLWKKKKIGLSSPVAIASRLYHGALNESKKHFRTSF